MSHSITASEDHHHTQLSVEHRLTLLLASHEKSATTQMAHLMAKIACDYECEEARQIAAASVERYRMRRKPRWIAP